VLLAELADLPRHCFAWQIPPIKFHPHVLLDWKGELVFFNLGTIAEALVFEKR